jgi:hypothetical protein
MPDWLRSWLGSAGSPADADLIFALAGRPHRKTFGLRLFREGRAPRLILSVARFEIRRFKELPLPEPLDLLPIAELVAPPKRHFFVIWDSVRKVRLIERIRMRRWGTIREIEALAKYLQGNRDVKSILVLTSGPHVRRVRMCCDALLPAEVEFTLVAAPDDARVALVGATGANNSTGDDSFGAGALELAKLILYKVLLLSRKRPKPVGESPEHK